MSFRQIKQCQSKINKHDSENLILSKYVYGASQIKNVLKESVLDMELKSRNTVEDTLYLESTMYWVGHARSNIVSYLTE